MSDEEKKAIDELKEEINKPVEVPEDKFNTFILYNIESAKIILNLIEKQSKEIEKIKEKNKPQPDCAEPVERTEEMVNMKWVNHNFIAKDKIKAKIEEIENEKEHYIDIIDDYNAQICDCIIEALQSLLEKE